MDKLVITNQVQQPDGKYKISYKATFTDDAYLNGHVFIGQDELEDMSMKEIRQTVATAVITNLGGTI